MRVRFGPWELDYDSGELTCEGQPVRLQPQPVKVLSFLVKRAGSLVMREELQRELWHTQSQVDFDQGLNYCIRQIRVVLKDSADEPTYIETFPRRGYRFRASTEEILPQIEPTKVSSASKPRRFFISSIILAAAIATVVLITALALRFTSTPRAVSGYTELTHDGMDKRGRGPTLGGTDAPLATDGRRIYFTEGTKDASTLMQVSITGGEAAAIRVPFSSPELLDFSVARSELLVTEHSDFATETPLWTVPVPAGEPRRLGDLVARDACWSPDGNQIAFTKGSELYRSNRDASGTAKLATLSGIGWAPRWSPDGKRLRLTVVAPDTNAHSLWEVSSNGTNLHPLLPRWSIPHAECCGNWTPDGKTFFFQATRDGKTQIWSLPGRSSLLTLSGSNTPVQITTGHMNSLASVPSPDGTTLYVIGQKLRGELSRYDAGTRQFLPILGGISADFAEFSRDGKWMLYVDYPNGTLWRSRTDGTQRLQLTYPPMEVMVPQWSPDGKRIVFFGFGTGQTKKIYIISADGGTPKPAVSGSDSEMSPSWSPDGNSILFSDFPFFGLDPAHVEVHIADLRTKKLATLPDSKGIFSPRWSPDGRYVAAIARRNDGIVLFDFQKQKWERLADGFGFFNFSQDSQYLYFRRHDPNPAILRINLKTHHIEEVANLTGIREGGQLASLQFSLDPNNAPVLLRDTGTQEIYAVQISH